MLGFLTTNTPPEIYTKFDIKPGSSLHQKEFVKQCLDSGKKPFSNNKRLKKFTRRSLHTEGRRYGGTPLQANSRNLSG